jgi:hypothetical protein
MPAPHDSNSPKGPLETLAKVEAAIEWYRAQAQPVPHYLIEAKKALGGQ